MTTIPSITQKQYIAEVAFNAATYFEKLLTKTGDLFQQTLWPCAGFWVGEQISQAVMAKNEYRFQQPSSSADEFLRVAIIGNVACLSLLGATLITKYVSASILQNRVS